MNLIIMNKRILTARERTRNDIINEKLFDLSRKTQIKI